MAEILQDNTKLIHDGFKHGAYIYRNIPFVNKLDALDFAMAHGDFNPLIRYYFHDHVFSKLRDEPNVSLDQLYINRARQLRETYDHIILLYSGGADSHEILKTFVNNGIFLDEVQNLHPHKLTEGKIDTQKLKQDGDDIIAEHLVTALPELKWLSEASPKTKIRIIDTTDSFFAIDDKYLNEYYNHFFNSFYSTQMNTAILDKDNNDLAMKKKVCMVWGNNKPLVVLDNNDNFYYGFNDLMRQFSPWLKESNRSPINFESFYWSIDAPLIPVKQSHLIMQKIQMDMNSGNYHSYNLLKNMDIHELHKWMKDVIYQYWNQNKYQAKSNTTDWHTLDENIYKYIPKIKSITEEKKNHYTNKYRRFENNITKHGFGGINLTRPGLGIFNTPKHLIGKLEKNPK